MNKNTVSSKRVCLVTWFESSNYGTNMQAYALVKTLRNLNCECLINDYVYKNIDFCNVYWVFNKIWQKLNSKLSYILQSKMRNDINIKFEKKLKKREELHKKYISDNYTLAGIRNKKQLLQLCGWADYFISGSDQAWNPYYLNRCYLLDFVKDGIPKVSYASSFGINRLPAWSKNTYKNLLNRYKYISVREKQGISIIQNLIDKKVEHVLDPTLLVTKKEWHEFADHAEIKRGVKELKNYILCYFVGDKEQYWIHVEKLKNITGLPVIVIPLNIETFLRNEDIYIEVGPYEFVWLIENASIVCTDSFHAVAFSLIFNKDFYVLKRFLDNDEKSQNSRLYSLLESLSLEDRYIDPHKNSINKIKKIEYEMINSTLEIRRNHSLSWLKNALDIKC